jgi:hypothetical protein
VKRANTHSAATNHLRVLDRFAQIQPTDPWPEALVHLAAYDR